MAANRIREFEALDGRRVGLAVRAGRRFDDCQLVSAGRDRTATLWVFADGVDTFVELNDVMDVWVAG